MQPTQYLVIHTQPTLDEYPKSYTQIQPCTQSQTHSQPSTQSDTHTANPVPDHTHTANPVPGQTHTANPVPKVIQTQPTQYPLIHIQSTQYPFIHTHRTQTGTASTQSHTHIAKPDLNVIHTVNPIPGHAMHTQPTQYLVKYADI